MVQRLNVFRWRGAWWLWFCAAIVLACTGTGAHAAPVITMIAEDPFAYPAGVPLTGQSGGSGWSSGWVSDSISFTDFFTSAPSQVVPGVTSTGGSMLYTFGGTQINDAARTLPLQNTGVVFLQFLSQFGAQSGGGTPSIRLSSGGVLTGGVGNNGGCGSPVYAILGSNLAPIAASCSAIALSTLSAVVVRIDYTANVTRMWVLPSLNGFDYLNPPAPSAEYAGLAPAFDRIAIYSRSPARMDELRVFRVTDSPAAPQPVPVLSNSGLWLLSGLLAVLAWRWRRQAN